MKLSGIVAVAAIAATASLPASAALVSLASNVDLSAGAHTVSIGSDASYTFAFAPDGLSDVTIAMTGTGEVYGNGFFSPNGPDPQQIDTLVPDQLSLGEFFHQTGAQPIPYSIAQVYVALRFVTGGETYYGYAGVGGSYLTDFVYNDTPGGSVYTGEQPAAPGAVPEPAGWTLMIAGFGLMGGALRRRPRADVTFA